MQDNQKEHIDMTQMRGNTMHLEIGLNNIVITYCEDDFQMSVLNSSTMLHGTNIT